ncbi:hypothetical protein HPB52_000446 [Rhipicephalus sanguineus]|uniref:Uncharacterized protein n=1 Tax=Rhipicephalus sanguineus TaxID=34632 RepID=A0A9D4SPN2_RHISA|nr:hypothetical protein HPB52_000446 [Rhipicephalus sanguineus]
MGQVVRSNHINSNECNPPLQFCRKNVVGKMSHGEDYDALSADNWKGQLDLDRPCGAVSTQQTCWLCDNFTAWNRAMRTLGLELEESMPGALLLQWSFDAQMGLDQVTTAREASLLASSLLRQHRCIQDLSMIDPYSNDYTEEHPPFQARNDGRAIRNVVAQQGITSISALLYHEEGRKFLDSLAQGMSGNRLILDFRCCSSDGINVPCTVLDSVRRNKAALNRAVEFVLRHRGRRGAECFELFVGRSCLMTHLTEVSGLSYVQARHEVGAAEHRLREKYFVLTGIVGRSVSCWPADSTQIDALNADCWRSLASYLRISDVPGDYDSVAKGMPPPLR